MLTIYTTPTCGYCEMAKKWCDENKISYCAVDITEYPEAKDLVLKKTGMLAVPVIQIENEFIVGFDKRRIQELLNKKPS